VAERVFEQLMQSRRQKLADGARVLSADYAFKQAIATGDRDTLLSALNNLRNRIGADSMQLVSMDALLKADTSRPDAYGGPFEFASLIELAEQSGEASGIVFQGNETHQAVVVPLLAPDPVAWLCITFRIGAALVGELKATTHADISLLHLRDNKAELIASTLPMPMQHELSANPTGIMSSISEPVMLIMGGSEHVSRGSILQQNGHGVVLAVLQRSMQEALQAFYRLRSMLLLISLLGLVLTAAGIFWLSRSVTRPVKLLAEGVREIEQHRFEHRISMDRQDEFGNLAGAFNNMAEGLVERDKVRDLLGKVVSPEVAHELMRSEVKLGGEERSMTAFFSDIAGFTSISEAMQAPDLVQLLNEYLTAMGEIIQQCGGVIDKYIGDAIVAFWGAPVTNEQHAEHAVRAAVRMQKRLEELRQQWREQGRTELFVRMGINSGAMVVGNMGSRDRMDYTMIGDAVNLAARLEGANKYYGSTILVSEFTHAMIQEVFLCRELDRIRVQGKNDAIRIYEVIAEIDNASPMMRDSAARFEEALRAFRRMRFEEAAPLFKHCIETTGDPASQLYLQRITDLVANPPAANWDWTYHISKL